MLYSMHDVSCMFLSDNVIRRLFPVRESISDNKMTTRDKEIPNNNIVEQNNIIWSKE